MKQLGGVNVLVPEEKENHLSKTGGQKVHKNQHQKAWHSLPLPGGAT
jgi:hypothetical protein